MSYKLIAFDMDGTLLDSNKKILPATLAAVNEASKRGKFIAISSGRCLPELKEIMETVPSMKYVIMTSGAMVYDFNLNQEIYSNLIQPKVVNSILKEIAGRDILIHFLYKESVVDKYKGKRLADYGMGIYQKLYNEIAIFVENSFDFYHENEMPLEKLNLYHRNSQDREETIRRLTGLPIEMKYAEGFSLECLAVGINKGTGLKKLCDYLGIDISETIAVGDADNDTEILETAGLAVAMGNASDSIKKLADVVVSDNDHNGCAEAIYNYLLKE